MAFTPGIQVPNETGGTKQNALQYEPENGHWQVLAMGFQRIGVISGCAVTAQGTPNQTTQVASGVICDGTTERTVSGGTVTHESADGTNPRFDLVMVNATTGALVNPTAGDGKGTAAANPVFPDITALTNRVILAVVWVPALDSAIESSAITDLRVFVPKIPRARFYSPSSQTLSAGLADIDWAGGTTTYDNDTMVDAANDRFNINTPGVYEIQASARIVETPTSNGFFELAITKNGTVISRVDMPIPTGFSSSAEEMQVVAMEKFAVGDTVKVQARAVTDASTALAPAASQSSHVFSIVRVADA